MSYAIMRFAKIKAGTVVACQKHNERENKNYSNEDINLELTHENYHLVECKNYKSAINKQIEERYLSMRSIRKDAVVGVEVIFTSDNEFFKKLSKEDERIYFEKSLEFLKDFVGEKNIISATIHKDEKTPHMHCIFTPIDNEGRLKYKSFINGRNDLIKLQDNYHKHISKFFELERGKSSKETGRVHLSVADYKLETAVKERELELENVTKNTEEIKSKNKDLEFKKNELEEQQNNVNLALEELKKFSEKIENDKKEKEKLEKLVLKLKERLTAENEKLNYIDNIMSNVEEKKSLFKDEVKISMDKELFKSLVSFARDGENYYKEKIEAKQKIVKLGTDYLTLSDKYKDLEGTVKYYKNLSSSFEKDTRALSKSVDLLKKDREKSMELSLQKDSYIEKLERAVPKEVLKKIREEIDRERNPWGTKLKKDKDRGFGLGD